MCGRVEVQQPAAGPVGKLQRGAVAERRRRVGVEQYSLQQVGHGSLARVGFRV